MFPLYSPALDFDRGRSSRRRPPRQALLSARSPRQIGTYRRASRHASRQGHREERQLSFTNPPQGAMKGRPVRSGRPFSLPEGPVFACSFPAPRLLRSHDDPDVRDRSDRSRHGRHDATDAGARVRQPVARRLTAALACPLSRRQVRDLAAGPCRRTRAARPVGDRSGDGPGADAGRQQEVRDRGDAERSRADAARTRADRQSARHRALRMGQRRQVDPRSARRRHLSRQPQWRRAPPDRDQGLRARRAGQRKGRLRVVRPRQRASRA